MLDKFLHLFINCWEKKTLPQDLGNSVFVSLHTNKGQNQNVQITAAALVLLKGLIPATAQENTEESQRGFTSNRGTTENDLKKKKKLAFSKSVCYCGQKKSEK